MNNTKNLGNGFKEALKNEAINLNNWLYVINAILKTNKILCDDNTSTIEINLAGECIDVSTWKGSIKPVKAIMSVVAKDDGESLTVEIGDMAMLMEDGTFRIK